MTQATHTRPSGNPGLSNLKRTPGKEREWQSHWLQRDLEHLNGKLSWYHREFGFDEGACDD